MRAVVCSYMGGAPERGRNTARPARRLGSPTQKQHAEWKFARAFFVHAAVRWTSTGRIANHFTGARGLAGCTSRLAHGYACTGKEIDGGSPAQSMSTTRPATAGW